MKFGIDIGHNCRPDTGTLGLPNGPTEDQLTMAVGTKLIQKLKDGGHTVVECRPSTASSVPESLQKRANKANQENVARSLLVATNGKCDRALVSKLGRSQLSYRQQHDKKAVMNAFTVNLHPVIELTDEQFYQLCLNNRDLKFERTAHGELLIMPPTGGETGRRNTKITTQLENWSSQNNLGVVFDSSTCFKLPNGADRSPDAAWVKRQRWDTLTPEQKVKFPPICPDFVIELRSPTDAIEKLREKMREYLANDCRLGWLIDPQTQQVEIYRPNQEVEVLLSPSTLSGEGVLPGFVLNLQPIMFLD